MREDPSGWKTLLTRVNQLVRSATHPAAGLPVEGMMPSLDGATGGRNSPPLTAAGLRGHVVPVNFWTYTCSNWLRTLPYLRAWAGRYTDQGPLVIGVHTPEFDFEHDLDNLRRQVKDWGRRPGRDRQRRRDLDRLQHPLLAGPVLRRRPGQIRHHRFGEGDHAMSELAVQQLRAEASAAAPTRD